jgi:hypothetical protein
MGPKEELERLFPENPELPTQQQEPHSFHKTGILLAELAFTKLYGRSALRMFSMISSCGMNITGEI